MKSGSEPLRGSCVARTRTSPPAQPHANRNRMAHAFFACAKFDAERTTDGASETTVCAISRRSARVNKRPPRVCGIAATP